MYKSFYIKTLVFLIIYFLYLSFISFSQTPKIDSLINQLNNQTSKDSIYVNLLNEIADKLIAIDTDKSYDYVSKALQVSESIGYQTGELNSLFVLGNIQFKKCNYQKSIELYKKSLLINTKLKKRYGIAINSNNIGNAYLYLGNYTEAIKYYEKALNAVEQLGDKRSVAQCMSNLGIIYKNQGNYAKALGYYEEALKTRKQFNDSIGLAQNYNNIGVIYYELEEFDKALKYYKLSLKLNKELKLNRATSQLLNNIALIYAKENKLDSSLTIYNQSIEIAQKYNFQHVLGWSYNGKGEIFEKQQQFEKALKFYNLGLEQRKIINEKRELAQSYNSIGKLYLTNDKYDKSLKNLLKAYEISKEIGSIQNIIHSTEGLALIYKYLGNYKQSLEYYIEFKQMSDSLIRESNIKKIAGFEIKMQYEKEKQAMKLEQLRNEEIQAEKDKKQTILTHSSITGFALMIVIVFLILKSHKQKRKSNILLEKQNLVLQDKNSKIEELNEELHGQKEELIHHRNHLEKIVQERTVDLKIAKDKAEESDRLKSAFLANLSHEIRTPMNAIVGFSAVLEEPDLPTDQRSLYRSLINQNCNSLLQLIDDILDLAKIETNQLILHKDKFDIHELLKKLLDTFNDLKNESEHKENIELKLNLESNSDKFYINSDSIRINKILSHMLDNALKFTEKGFIEFGYKCESPEYVTFFVKDSGTGISKEKAESIFDRFIKININKNVIYRGTGLGLAICKDLIQLLNGEIWFESEISKGSTFYFSIPV